MNTGCKDCKWHYIKTGHSEMTGDWHKHYCKHPDNVRESYNAMDGAYNVQDWDLWEKNKNGTCECFEQKPNVAKKKRWWRRNE